MCRDFNNLFLKTLTSIKDLIKTRKKNKKEISEEVEKMKTFLKELPR